MSKKIKETKPSTTLVKKDNVSPIIYTEKGVKIDTNAV